MIVAAVNTGMAAPPVVVGLLVSLFLTRNGPLGDFRLLYTTWAMVIAQVVIALPIVAGLSLAALQQLDAGLRQQIGALGAGRLQAFCCCCARSRWRCWRPSWPPSAASSARSAR